MRDINLLPTWLYYLHDKDGEDIYVGVTCHLPSRLDQHRQKAWWGEVAHIIAYLFPEREQALAWEALHIRGCRPAYNREVPPEPVLHPDWCWFCRWIGATDGAPDDDFSESTWPIEQVQSASRCRRCIKAVIT